ncbi:MAG: CYTH domain-containing protein, partial [Burkholderiales bacterium]
MRDVDPHREIELKLEASPEDLRRLRRHPLVRSLAQSRAVTQKLESVYFDTEDHDLAEASLALRVRRIGARRVQTVKGERSAAGGLFERTELEIPIHGDQPNLARIADPDLRARLVDVVGGSPLVEVFRTEFRRTRRVLRKGETEWTLDIDEGRIAAGDRSARVHEAELELREGDPAKLFEFALLLQERLDLRPGARSKAERGYALARGEGAAAHPSRRVRIDPDATLEDAVVAIFSHCLAHFTANADCASEGVDPEGVHQMRVGVRRTRAAVALFEALLPAERLRWFHLAGALLGLIGAALLVTEGRAFSFKAEFALGYLAAAACALTWSVYSVMNRRYGAVPTDVVGGFCGATAVLGVFAHLVFEETVIPDTTQWLAALALGLGPVGAAFFFWDYGTKHGHIQAL